MRRRLAPGSVGWLFGLGLAWAEVSLAGAAEYVGAETCRSCHEAQYRQWRSSPHAMALARLTSVQARDRSCRSCHTMAPADSDPALAGVQCESCHGSGGLYAPRYVMRDAVLSRLLGLRDPTEEICARCHTADSPSLKPFEFNAALARVAHGTRPPKANRPAAAPAPAPALPATPAAPGTP